LTIPALTARACESFGERLAVIDGDSQLTFAELHDAAKAFGAALVARGVEMGDRVAIWAPNSIEWVVAILGLFEAGATLVPVNTRFKGREAAEILARSQARVLVTVTDFLGTDYVAALRGAEVDLPSLDTVVVARGPIPDRTTSWSDFLAAAGGSDRAEVDRRALAVSDDDVSDILFTSGTTGVAKGVVQTHGRTLGVATDWVLMTGMAAGDRYLMVNPYFHMFGLKAGILASLVAGATMLPEPVFEVERVLQRVADERVTVLPGAPTIYQSILDHPDRAQYDLSSLRIAVTGAADIPVELIRRIIDELPFPTVIAGYGLTEGGTAAATAPRPGFELRIVDRDGADRPTGEPGEILLRSQTVMSHYLDDPDATAEVLTPDGWLRTGDLGELDGHGNLRIVGRVKDMFIVGGFNAYPAEIENALLRNPDIQQAAVIGVPDQRLGEVTMAFVVLRPGSTTSGEDIITWSRQQMANYKVPRKVELVDELPLNAAGKVVKDLLRQRASP
jgi:acyl-CoA synthetase (AMP-forming)/AMP-acid ligase II